MKTTMQIFLFIAALFLPETTKAQSAIYLCTTTGTYGYCYGNNYVSTCAYENCIKNGGKHPTQITYSSRKGYGAIATGRDFNGVPIVGAAAGCKTEEEAIKNAKHACISTGAQSASIAETFYDE